jgi:hypothetical protein
LRAVTGARLVQKYKFTVHEAALMVGSNPVYVKAGLVLLQSENSQLRDNALAGRISLLAAAAKAKPVAKIVAAIRAATADDLAIAGRIIGAKAVWETMVAAVI